MLKASFVPLKYSARLKALLVLALCVVAVASYRELGGGVLAEASKGAVAGAAARPDGGRTTMRAAGQTIAQISLTEGRELPTNYEGPAASRQALEQNQARPLALASADLDEDGVADLIGAYAAGRGGIITLHRGNADSIFPNSPDAARRKATGEFTGSPFLSPAASFELAVAPDFIAAGDFDNDGHQDVAAAARGSNLLYFLRGDGRGGFSAARERLLPGAVTALASGDVNCADGLADLIVATLGADGPQALVFEGAEGAINASPESFSLAAEATSLAVGQLDDDTAVDLAVAAGTELIVVHGRDRGLASHKPPARAAQPVIERHSFSSRLKSVAIGDFAGNRRAGVAVLDDNGSVQALSRIEQGQEGAQAGQKRDERWSTHSLVSSRWPRATALVCARLSSTHSDSLLVLDAANSQLHVATSYGEADGAANSERQPFESMSFEAEGGPVAVLPMRLNADAPADIVVLESGKSLPTVALSQAKAIFVVTNNLDSGAGSLRQAILDANASRGADIITFNIADARARTINLRSGLPEITEAVTIDATTNPGFAGVPIVEISGAAITDGSSGLVISGGSTTVRGLVINRFGDGIRIVKNGGNIIEGNFIGTDAAGTAAAPNAGDGVRVVGAINNIIGGSSAAARNLISGNEGNGLTLVGPDATGNQVQGNFIGTDRTGATALGNRGDGVRAGSSNVIGGRSAQSRNVISGNLQNGVNITASNNVVQGNFIGTDRAGLSALANSGFGVSIAAPKNLIGGTSVAAANTIAFNLAGGVRVVTGNGNGILSNSIFSNNATGINLSRPEASAAARAEGGAGANNLQSSPKLISASRSGAGVAIKARLDSTPRTTFRIEFFANPDCNASRSCQGRRFLGSSDVTTSRKGSAQIEVTLAVATGAGEAITATATDPAYNTSEFSPSKTVTAAACTKTFDNDGGDSLWLNPINWNNDTLPGAGDDVCIGSSFSVTLDGDQSINSIASDGTLTITGATLSVAAPSSFNNLTLAGGGTLTGAGGFTITGTMDFFSGTISGTSQLNIASGATLNIAGDVLHTISQVTVNNSGTVSWTGGNIQLLNGAVFNNLATGTFNATGGMISGAGTFNNAGTFTKCCSGGTAQFDATVVFNNTGAISVDTGTLDVGADFTQTAGSTTLNGGSLSGTTINIQGGVLSGAGTITGDVVVSGGGQFNPGSPLGIITVIGDYTQAADGILNIQIGGLTPGTEFDRLEGFARGTLNGTLNVTLVNGFSPAVGDEFEIIFTDLRIGTFATINGLNLGGGKAFQANYTVGGLILTTVAVASADLVVTNTDSPDPVQTGSNLTYTIKISNAGPDTATSVMFSGEVAAGTTFVSLASSNSITCSTPAVGASGPITCQLGSMLSEDIVTLTLVVNVTAPAGSTITNTASASSSTSELDPADNSAQATTNVVAVPVCVITCPADQAVNTGPGAAQCGAVVNYPAPTTSGPCGSVTCNPPSGTFFPVGTTAVTCSGGAASSCSFNVTVRDNTPPTINCPANVTQSTAANQCSAVVNYPLPTVSDNCPGVSVPTCTPASNTAFPVGTTTVTCNVTDTTANTASCSFLVTVNDNQPPGITCPANVTQSTGANQCSATVNYATPTVTDNCPGATFNCAPASGSSFAKGTTSVTCTATDAAGNTATCGFTVTVTDNQPPSITCPANQTVVAGSSAGTAVNYPSPVVTDNCPGSTFVCAPASGSLFPVGTTSVSCTATDGSGNTATCAFNVTVTEPCPLTCPANMSVNTAANSARCGAFVNYPAATSVGSSCGAVVCAPASGSFFSVGATTVTCTNSNGSVCSFIVTVVDTTPPTVTCPGGIVTTVRGERSKVVSYAPPSVRDNCSGTFIIQCVPPSEASFPLGTTNVTCSVIDNAGNTGSCSFTVTVSDTLVPTISCPPGVITEATAGQCSAVVNYPAPDISGNPAGTTSVCAPPSGSTFPLGTSNVTCTVTSATGNRSSCSFAVRVNGPAQAKVTLEGNKAALEFGPADPPRKRKKNPPSSCDCDSTFTIENTGCALLDLSLASINRTGSDVDNGRITNTDDRELFSVRAINADGVETILDLAAHVTIAPGQRQSFRVVFNPAIPATFSGKTSGLSAEDVLPDTVTSRVTFTQSAGPAVAINLIGRVSTDVRLLDPQNPRKPKRIIFERAGDEFTITLGAFDSNLDVDKLKFEFLDSSDRVVGQAISVDLVQPIKASNIIKGQNFTVQQKFSGAQTNTQITGVRVTISDPGSSDTATARLGQSAQSLSTQTSAAARGSALVLPGRKLDLLLP